MADNTERLKIIAGNVESLYQAMRRAAGNIAGLLQVGRATCDEVRAYNLWAIACFNTQKGMLATLRANGETGVPELPTAPTLFAWRGQSGANAFQISCAGEVKSLDGALRDAMNGKNPQYLSTNDMEIQTGDRFVLDPVNSPSFAALYNAQQANAQQGVNGLGAAFLIFIAVAGIVVGVGVAITAIMKYLETSDIQENNSKQVAMQANAYADYLSARLDCYKTCTGEGKSTETCVATCAKLVAAPKITLPGQGKPWGWLQWTGFTVVVGAGALVVHRMWSRRAAGKPVFELPDFPG
jgi:hypothetical protein